MWQQFRDHSSHSRQFLLVPLIIGLLVSWKAQAIEEEWLRNHQVSRQVNAPVAKAWQAWTTTAGLKSFFATDGFVEAKSGGRFEIYFLPTAPAGERGSDNGTSILAMQPEKWLMFTWGMPPYMPAIRPHLTVVQVHFEALSQDQTRVTLHHSGFGSGPDWDKGFHYFDNAWNIILSNFKHAIEVGPIDWDAYNKEYKETGTISWWQK